VISTHSQEGPEEEIWKPKEVDVNNDYTLASTGECTITRGSKWRYLYAQSAVPASRTGEQRIQQVWKLKLHISYRKLHRYAQLRLQIRECPDYINTMNLGCD
jgi:hypothetical protein